MKSLTIVMLAVCLASAPISCVSGQSLWQDGTNYIGDDRPSRVGDIVMVEVDERSDTEDEAKTETTKEGGANVSEGTGILDFIKGLSLTSSTTSTGDGSSERSYRTRAKVTCVVTEVLPNGNLIIEGTRDLQTHGETLKMRFRGAIRPQDVDGDNTISSERVANVDLIVDGKGTLTRLQKPGMLTQILQAIF
ncbi:flagellar basal body L-ring protein FlgH [Dethiosulfovibrio sp. F2B]|uniref:flagellar basal body L-ring protein FlgH n=1 Tax=Dethiosulfovibrio faecalis TaxID=2720018 RepID=UPI001F27DFDF|nr:flagellar basal body L-ring protein FlgH [Dethiosulfovibrio faecalis]MCF4152435.1 flagellar basal body L-ring protein FlgH [Dethiosulfovibrio faecalis]